ncbi:UNVERIFIED_CONTAM: hypothetical protein GTU68_024132 [Idotea baltica]|nr:hypothetical protein [Idotea baltica]
MQFMLLFSRQGKLRLQKWYEAYPDKVKKKITRELISTILTRKPKMSSFIEWKDLKIVYKRYASLYFCCAIEQEDNELLTLEVIHRYVELLDKYFGSVCELDIIFNFEKAYFMLDELLVGGEVCETSKKNVLKAIAAQDLLQEVSYTIMLLDLTFAGVLFEFGPGLLDLGMFCKLPALVIFDFLFARNYLGTVLH